MDGGIEVVEGVLLNMICDFGRNRRQGPRFFYDHQPVCFLYRFYHGLIIDGTNGTEVNHLGRYIFFFKLGRSSQGHFHDLAKRHKSHIRSGSLDVG